MHRHTGNLLTPLLTLALTACSAGHSEETPGVIDAQPADTTVVHSLTVEGSEYEFHLTTSPEGERVPSLVAHTPIHNGKDAVNALLEKYGSLTMLEIYLALSDGESPPHEGLVEHHAIETAAMGRADDAIIDASVDLESLADKSAADCESYVRTKMFHGGFFSSSAAWCGPGCSFAAKNFGVVSKHQMAVAVCNHSNVNETRTLYIDWGPSGSPNWQKYGGPYNTAPNVNAYFWYAYTNEPKNIMMQVTGNQTSPDLFAARAVGYTPVVR